MNKWCQIVEHNNKQFLFTHEWNAEKEVDEIILKTDFSSDYPESGVGIIACNFGAKSEDGFNDEEFQEFISIKKIEEFENGIKKLMEKMNNGN